MKSQDQTVPAIVVLVPFLDGFENDFGHGNLPEGFGAQL